MIEVWFWQLIISPHMINLADELALLGVKVNYVVQSEISEGREKLGWTNTDHPNINIIKVDTYSLSQLIQSINTDAYHIVQGLRSNGYISDVIKELVKDNSKFWVILETIDSRGMKGYLRKLIYKGIHRRLSHYITGYLTIGYNTKQWFENIGVPKYKLLPFTYFLDTKLSPNQTKNDKYIFIFVGNLIERKRPELILHSLNQLKTKGKKDFELWIIGGGSLEPKLIDISKALDIPVTFYGYQSIKKVRSYIASADCLILPSIFDGWGAVASEAIIEGTPVICSDACGVAGVVEKSRYGSVFSSLNKKQFFDLVETHYDIGKISEKDRYELQNWGKCLTAPIGAKYLYNILCSNQLDRPLPPWDKKNYD